MVSIPVRDGNRSELGGPRNPSPRVATLLQRRVARGARNLAANTDVDLTQGLRRAGPKSRFAGPVEVDETYVGGKAKNMHASKRKHLMAKRGPADKAIVVGMRDRPTGQVTSAVVLDTWPAQPTGVRPREER